MSVHVLLILIFNLRIHACKHKRTQTHTNSTAQHSTGQVRVLLPPHILSFLLFSPPAIYSSPPRDAFPSHIVIPPSLLSPSSSSSGIKGMSSSSASPIAPTPRFQYRRSVNGFFKCMFGTECHIGMSPCYHHRVYRTVGSPLVTVREGINTYSLII